MDRPLVIQYQLREGGLIFDFLGQTLAFSETIQDPPVILKENAAILIKKLLEKKNDLVKYCELYCAYHNLSKVDDSDEIHTLVHKMMYKIPKKLRHKIDNRTEEGYSLGVARTIPIFESISNVNESYTSNKYRYLSGEYLAYYLVPDPHPQKDQMLGAFLQIQEQIDSITVNAIFDIKSDKALARVAELFSGNVVYSQKLAEIRKEYPEINTNCWFSGTLC